MMKMRDKMMKMLSDLPELNAVDVCIKVRTRDGMNYTMMVRNIRKTDDLEVPFHEFVVSDVTQTLIDLTNQIEEEPDKFDLSVEEGVAVRHGEIARVWADIDSAYVKEDRTIQMV